MIRNLVRGLGPLLISAAVLSSAPALAQGVPTVDLTSIAKIGEVLTEAKLQVKEMIASNLKLDEQILKQIEQIATLKAQLDALRNGLTLEAFSQTVAITVLCEVLNTHSLMMTKVIGHTQRLNTIHRRGLLLCGNYGFAISARKLRHCNWGYTFSWRVMVIPR